MNFETQALKPKVGSEIKASREVLLSGAIAKDIRKIAHERGVVLFRHADMDEDQLIAFTKTLGKLGPEYSPPEMLEVILSVPEYEKTAFLWHIDAITEEMPTAGTVVSFRKRAPSGGHNEWASTVAAYDDLPDSEKKALEKLRVVHSFEWLQRMVEPQPRYEELLRWQQFKPKTHPLVWKHASGLKSLVLGSTASHIEGMSLEEGRALICRLQEWILQPDYIYTHEWTMGEVALWDNTTVLHRATPYPIGAGRENRLIPLDGEEPILAAA